ncbi:MAG: YciI family protein [Bacteroidia bacterium]|nr:YciI family protein [Bacteroidia bacterium]
MKNQNEFMLVFRFEPNFNHQPTQAELTEMGQQWGAYFGELGGQGKMVSTHQLGFEGMVISADHSVSEGIHITNKQTLGGNLIVKADTMKEAVEIGKKCPILLMGGTVEVRSIQPM